MALQHYNTPALQTAPVRQKVSNFLTPSIADLIFIQTVEGYRGQHPEYGTQHPDSEKWPNHVLCYVKQEDPTGAVFSYYYAAKREAQDLYNWEQTTADIGQTKFDAVKRTYFVLRSEYDENSISMGDLMVDPENRFDGAYVLAMRTQTRVQDKELDSIYVLDEQTFIKKVTLLEARYDEHVGRGNGNINFVYYRGEYPPEYPKNSVNAAKIEDIFKDPTHPYWGLQPGGTGVIRNGDQLSDNWFAVKEGSVIAPSAVNSATNPAKKLQVTRLTPLASDILFVECGTMPTPAPAYGTPHYNTSLWPNHSLCYIAPTQGDLSGLMYDFYYVADRQSQDLYNLERVTTKVTNEFGSAVTHRRTYIHPRGQGATWPFTGTLESGIVELKRETGLTGITQIDGMYEKTVITYGTVPALKISKQIDKTVPDKFTYSGKVTATKETSLQPLDLVSSVSTGTKQETLQDGPVYTRETTAQDRVVPVYGSRSYIEKERVSVTETIVDDYTPADRGLNVFDSQVSAIGHGLAVKTTAIAEGLGPYYGSEWDDVLMVSIPFEEHYASTPSYAPYTQSQCINKDRYLIRTYTPPTNLDHLTYSYQGIESISFPPMFLGATPFVNTAQGGGGGSTTGAAEGSGDSWSASYQVSQKSSQSMSAHGAVSVQMAHKSGSNLPTKTTVFYAPLGQTFNNFLPTYNLVTFDIVVNSQKITWATTNEEQHSKSYGAARSATSQESRSEGISFGSSIDYDLSSSTDIVTVGPCLMGGRVIPTNLAIHAYDDEGNRAASAVASIDALHPTYTDSYPSGEYTLKVDVRPYKWGLAQYAVTKIYV